MYWDSYTDTQEFFRFLHILSCSLIYTGEYLCVRSQAHLFFGGPSRSSLRIRDLHQCPSRYMITLLTKGFKPAIFLAQVSISIYCGSVHPCFKYLPNTVSWKVWSLSQEVQGMGQGIPWTRCQSNIGPFHTCV